MQFQLDLREIALQHFAIGADTTEVEMAIANEAVEFAAVAIREYQALEKKAIESLTRSTDDDALINVFDDDPPTGSDVDLGPSEITAAELVKVVELSRSLRRGHSPAGDVYAILQYLYHREAQETDWEGLMTDLRDLYGPEESKEG